MNSKKRKIQHGGICDSCNKVVDILIPIRILCETSSGEEMQLHHYCPECFEDITEDWEPPRGDD